jgi:hypothetical protein
MENHTISRDDDQDRLTLAERIRLAEDAVLDYEIVLHDCLDDARGAIEPLRDARLNHAEACRRLEALLEEAARWP